MKFIYLYTVDTAKVKNNNVSNTTPVPFASRTAFNSGEVTSCLGFCHINLKRIIPLNNDYSLNNDYYIIGITNSKTLGPNEGIFIYYIMKVEEIITFATAYERFPEWRADNYKKAKKRPIPIRPITNNYLMKHMETRRLYLVNENNEIIKSFPYKFKTKDQRVIHETIKNNFNNMSICVKVDSYDHEFIVKEKKLEAGKFINQENNYFSIIYKYIPKVHHNEVQIAFKDLKKQKKSHPFKIQNTQSNQRNGDRFFISYRNFKYFGMTSSSEFDFCNSYFEIEDEILNILKSNLRKYVSDTYMKSINRRTPRGKNPHMAKINPLVIKGKDVSKILDIIAPEFN